MEVGRIGGFRRALQERLAERRVESAHGTALLCDSLRDVYELNYLRLDRGGEAQELAAEAERALDGCFHRRIVADEAPPPRELDGLGWSQTIHLVMALRRPADRAVDTAAVREVPFEAIEPLRARLILDEPWGDAEVARSLNEAKRRVLAAVPTRFLAACQGGEPLAWCEVRSAGGVAQIEDVNTLPEARGRGLGRAVVQRAADEARAAHDVVFLEALADDWPRELYARLGFDAVGERHLFQLPAHPLTRLRLRTPRLELRLATVAELRRLYAVAEAGIHDPAEMPFAVAWTDDLNLPDFLAHMTAVDPKALLLVAFLDGEPVGVQELDLALPEVRTGSWLGRAHQGRGLGTEMRTAVLAFAFGHLGAEVARSGAIQGNPQSLGVSRTLGYERVGEHLVSPRGEPVVHTDVELRRERFRPPVEVEVAGPLPTLLPLLGA